MFRVQLWTTLAIVFLTQAGWVRPALALAEPAHPPFSKPNIVIILADDMGFSDIAPYGGEIDTPNLSRLAENGLKYTQFYNTGRCCPTRASLITGLHPAQTGIGHMTEGPLNRESEDRHIIGYRGRLNNEVTTIAEVLKSAGYHTIHSGKWHLGYHDPENKPLQRGFDDHYGLLAGASNYFTPRDDRGGRGLTRGNDKIEAVSTTDDAFYTTDAFTDEAINYIGETEKNTPFFLYLAYTAPHWPLQAFEEDIAKYRGQYRKGWEQLRAERYQRQVESGLIDPDTTPMSERDAIAWDSLPEKKQDEMDLRMAIYAAQIDRMDQNIGKLLKSLEAQDRLENTIIFFLSDNGGCAEGGMLGSGEVYDLEERNEGYFTNYGQAWANASNTPFRLYKHFVHEGGMATPMIVHWPAGIEAKDEWRRDPAYLPDLMATAVELSGATYPETRDGEAVQPMVGTSLARTFDGSALDRNGPMFWEHEGNRAIRIGDWKLVSRGTSRFDFGGEQSWELYDLSADRSELNDLAGEQPDRVKELSAAWWDWAKSHRVVPNRKKDVEE